MEAILRNPKIFVIYGKARSGKNTVSDIIREFYNQKNLKTLNISYSEAVKNYAMKLTSWDGNEKTKPRSLLQMLGTDIVRNKIDEMFFVNRLMNDIKFYSYFYDVLTISDARFINEIETPKKLFKDVVIIKVINPNSNSDLTLSEKQHISETELDDFKNYDYEIINNSDIKQLKEKIIKILEKEVN
ncbi:MAG: hypothetical protein PHN42_04615 [Bacilli bacterium]|nr:hypothetical protein [Bacilli bacterium]